MNNTNGYMKALRERYEQCMTEQAIALDHNDYELCGELEKEMEQLGREMSACFTTPLQ